MKKLVLKSLIFLFVFFGIIYNIDHYFVNEGNVFKKYCSFYKHDKNTLNAIILGNSHADEGISSDIIKAKTGLNTFNFGIGGISFFETYYNLLETLTYQKPKLVIIENYILASQEKDDSLDKSAQRQRKYQSTLYCKKIGVTKFKEARLSIPNYNVLKTFNVFKYHENWSDLVDVFKVVDAYNKKMEYPYMDSSKNIMFMSNEIAENFNKKRYDSPFYLSENSKEYLHKIIALSKEKDFKLLFVTLPFYERYYQKRKVEIDAFHSELETFLNSQDRSIKLLDLNKKIKFDKTNFRGVPNEKKYDYRNQHLNYKGNIKVTNLISNYIKDTYSFTKTINDFETPQDIFYSFKKNSDSTQFEGNIVDISKSVISKFEGTLEEATAIEKTKKNGLKFSNQLDNPVWHKNAVKVTPNCMITPNGERTAEKIIGTGTGDGHILQSFPKKTGTFKWSIWLKGTGTTRLVLQESGGDYTLYSTYNIELTPNWCQYSLVVNKEDDSNSLWCVLSGIQNSDILYSWGAKLTEIGNDSKLKVTLEEATAIEKKENNALKFKHQLDNSVWYKEGIKVTPNCMLAPNGTRTAEKITGTGIGDGHILQSFPKKTGVFKWSVWLKGTGTTRLALQENGDDYTLYNTYNIVLTPNWKQYSLVVNKEDDSNSLWCVIGHIQSSDILYSWGAQLTVLENNLKIIDDSKFERTIREVTAVEKTENNGLKFSNQLDNPVWHKNAVKVTPNCMIAPNGKRTAEKIIGTGTSDGHILQSFPKKTGVFKWSVWLKGTGATRLVLQENGDDYTYYSTYNIELTPNWSQYSLVVNKEDDSNSLWCVVSGIQNSDILYLWGAQLTEIKNDSKKNNDIIIPKDANMIKLTGWMSLNNRAIKNKYIVLKKDEEFSYISLKTQIKNQGFTKKPGEDDIGGAYNFEITKSILEKGRYEIFQIAKSDENKFFIKKLSNSVIIK